MVRFAESKSGSLAAIANGAYLNSRYDPVEEARKVAASKLGSAHPKTVIILGETLGYLTEAVAAHSPGCRCVQVFYDGDLYERCPVRTVAVWHPAAGLSLDGFFRRVIHELEIEDLTFIEWVPSAKAYPVVAATALNSLRRTIAICNGNVSTTAGFGKRWLRNTVHNYLAVDRISDTLPKADLVVVAASGPSLQNSMKTLLENRSTFFLIALPSSLIALAESGIWPDLLVITDPGYYSGVHLAPASQRSINAAMPYTAVRDTGRYASQIVLLNQGTFLENALLKRSGIPHLQVGQIGTVAGTALLLAGAIGTTVVVTGLDLTHRDMQTHVRPHAFDRLLDCTGKRTLPVQTIKYLRAFGNRLRSDSGGEIGAYNTYAGWFTSAAFPGLSLYRLLPSPVSIDGMKPLDAEAFTILCAARSRPEPWRNGDILPPVKKKKSLLLSILTEARSALQKAEPENPREYTKPTPLSMVYIASAQTLLKALKSADTGVFEEAVAGAIGLIDELADYVDAWPA